MNLLETEEEKERDAILQDAREKGIITNEQFVKLSDEELLSIIERHKTGENAAQNRKNICSLETKYAAKNRKIPISIQRMNIIYETIKTFDGITRKELLKEVKGFGIKKTALYDWVRKMLKDGSIYMDLDRRLHINGKPRPPVAEWKAHNTYWKLTKAREAWAIVQFCEYLNKTLFAGSTRKAFPNPTNWREKSAKQLREFRIECGDEPLTYEELQMVRKAMKDFFGYIPKFKVKAEVNQDTEGGEKMITSYLQLSYLGRTMRTYSHKNKRGKKDKRKEILTEYMEIGEMEECMKNDITLHQSIREKQRLAKIAKEERKKKNKLEYNLEQKENELKETKMELQKAHETIQKLQKET